MRREDRTIEVANYFWPAGISVHPPRMQTPYWHTVAARRLHYREVVLGQDADATSEIAAVHASAIAELVREAETARVHRDGVAMRALVAAATRLCNEVAGQAPIPH